MLLTFIANMHGLFLLKDKESVTIVNSFQKILDDSMELHSKGKQITYG